MRPVNRIQRLYSTKPKAQSNHETNQVDDRWIGISPGFGQLLATSRKSSTGGQEGHLGTWVFEDTTQRQCHWTLFDLTLPVDGPESHDFILLIRTLNQDTNDVKGRTRMVGTNICSVSLVTNERLSCILVCNI